MTSRSFLKHDHDDIGCEGAVKGVNPTAARPSLPAGHDAELNTRVALPDTSSTPTPPSMRRLCSKRQRINMPRWLAVPENTESAVICGRAAGKPAAAGTKSDVEKVPPGEAKPLLGSSTALRGDGARRPPLTPSVVGVERDAVSTNGGWKAGSFPFRVYKMAPPRGERGSFTEETEGGHGERDERRCSCGSEVSFVTPSSIW
ncbi:hypothetical protein BHM03_00043966 [Ensete ventricosum]|nr:hypothetical protein BHM03_00043966 [Ensete ventricosum]